MTVLHHLLVVAFLLLYTYKIGLLLVERADLLAYLRARAPWLDGLIGTAVVVSGGAVAFAYNGTWPLWLFVKIGLVIALLPLTLIALQRNQRPLALLT
jgi:nicotinamide riboside transporter PnuC